MIYFIIVTLSLGGIIMIGFVNTFLTYLILVVISMGVIIAGVICGKKLRESKDAKAAAQAAEDKADKEN